jgi:tRNA(fMet)-specific endonuclease VapC
MYLLDTDHLSLLQRQGNSAQPLIQRLQLNMSLIAATVISYEEQTRGWMKYFSQAKNLEQQVIAYQRLQQHAINYCNITLLPFDIRAAEQFQQLRKQYPRLDTMDLKIAAIALTNNAILLTRNQKDFGQIQGLNIEDWSNPMGS